jgi:hypothetical protein
VGALKLWDGSAWRTAPSGVGPQGPPGDPSTDYSPRGVAGGGLADMYPNPSINRSVAGTLLNSQSLRGVAGGTWSAIANNYLLSTSGAQNAAPLLQLVYVPPVDAWWTVNCKSWFNKTDAAYHYGYLCLALSPADQDGLSVVRLIEMQHSTVQTVCWRQARMTWRLAANQSYTCFARFECSGGGWNVMQNDQSMVIDGMAYAQ